MIDLYLIDKVQTFLPISLSRKDNFVYHHWICISIYVPLSYPLRSPINYNNVGVFRYKQAVVFWQMMRLYQNKLKYIAIFYALNNIHQEN